MTDATVAASAAAAGVVAAVTVPEAGLLICAAVGAAAGAVVQAPPQEITLPWAVLALARGVGFVGVGLVAPYLLPSLPGLHALGSAPPMAVALLASGLAPIILDRVLGRSAGAVGNSGNNGGGANGNSKGT